MLHGHALVGLLTSELEPTQAFSSSSGYLEPEATMASQMVDSSFDRSVTAAGPSRNCTGVPLSVGRKSSRGRPPTHDSSEFNTGERRCQTDCCVNRPAQGVFPYTLDVNRKAIAD